MWGTHEFNWDDLTLVAAWFNFRTTMITEVHLMPMNPHIHIYLMSNKNITGLMTEEDFEFGFLHILPAAKSAQFSMHVTGFTQLQRLREIESHMCQYFQTTTFRSCTHTRL